MPKNLNNAKITQRLVEAFQLKGRYIPMLDEVIVPTYVIEDPAPAHPNRLAAGFVRIDGVEDPSLALVNPAGSGVMIVVTFANLTVGKLTGAADTISIGGFLRAGDIGVDASLKTSSQWRDSRLRGTVSDTPYGVMVANTSGAAGRQLFERAVFLDNANPLVNTAVIEAPLMGPRQPPVVLGPDAALVLLPDAGIPGSSTNSILNCVWEEIPLMGGLSNVSGTPP